MAINISQFPTFPNMANSDLLFTVTSSQASQPQFQFVADLTYSGSATVLQRIKQQPNPSGFGVFDFGQIVSSYLESDNSWKATAYVTASNVAKRFSFKFGEEYGTSTSSSVTLYTGVSTNVGNPAVTASNYYQIINGLVEPNDAVNWNWPSQSYFQPVTVATAIATGSALQAEFALTYAPVTKSIQRDDYETISLLNGNFNNSSTVAQDIYAILVEQYSADNVLVSSSYIANLKAFGGGPRTSGFEFWSDVYTNQTPGMQLLTIGVGPLNLSGSGFPITTSCAYYTVKATQQETADNPDENKWFSYRRYNIEGPSCGYDGVRFAWKNEFGVWDYYTFTLQSDSSFNIERNSFEKTFVDFSTTSKTVAYNRERRGSSQFYNDLDQLQTANSNWLTQAEADWLRELFFSTNVYQYVNGNFFPVVITSANVVEKTNPRTQKTFQYQIEFKPANQLRPRI